MSDTHVTCPNCGYGYDNLRKSTRMFDCPSCGTTLFREGVQLNPIGNHGEMHEFPMLLGLHDSVTLDGSTYLVAGHARYDYGRGTWDELWLEDDRGQGGWLSLDEGDIVFQRELGEGAVPNLTSPPRVGESFTTSNGEFTVTEADVATCVAMRGQFPELIQVGDEHYFVNCSGPGGLLLSGEFWEGGQAWLLGRWSDPFALKVRRHT